MSPMSTLNGLPLRVQVFARIASNLEESSVHPTNIDSYESIGCSCKGKAISYMVT